jgi:probable rRNA maturation factor
VRARQPSRLSLEIRAEVAAPGLSFIRGKLLAAHGILKPALRELSVALVGASRMSGLHEKFAGEAGPTDVLSFELAHDHRGRVIGGEVVVCVAVAKIQAKRRGIELKHELLLYALHGMLHLCGLDDRTEKSHRAMHALEDRILTKLGVGPVFGDLKCIWS